ncbi:LOW QUALITY PROTEIN: hypothetical protein Cgig2_032960 [Carnegiea gigantea]|uniref:Uncharacterized protein n=1 Tax=Carnegiea gigantea TaxID=171969 RepID=A0A9Q1JN20_9CARY|nr:LOW QUALITY PROTEIN: hypothetical protein Cgig2_032960 [Carnegiea gigantea]
MAKKKTEKKGDRDEKQGPPKKIVDDKEKTHKSAEIAVEKEALPVKPAEKRSKKTKAGKDKCEKAAKKTLEKTPTKSEKKQRGEKPGETKKEKLKKKAVPVRRSQWVQNLSKPPALQGYISEVDISSNTSDDTESSAREVKSNDERYDKSSKKPQEEKEPFNKSPTRLQHKEKREETKMQELKKKPVAVRQSQRVQGLSKPTAQQPDVFDIHTPKSADVVETVLTREHEDVDDNANKKEGEEETHIQGPPKAVPKTKKPALKI